MQKTFSIVIVEDHTILREGRKSLLSSHPDLKAVGEAGGRPRSDPLRPESLSGFGSYGSFNA
jgi:DNA-binding NarL/FixJ family response regulator